MNPSEFAARARAFNSGEWHYEKVDKEKFLSAFAAVMAGGEVLDKYKKSLFYGKEPAEPVECSMGDIRFMKQIPSLLGMPQPMPDKRGENFMHGLIGLATELAELADAAFNTITDNKYADETTKLDTVNVVEEIGDMLWYMALILGACNSSFAEAMEKNIAKLTARYGKKFTQDAALNRDLWKERQILEGELQGTKASQVIMDEIGTKTTDVCQTCRGVGYTSDDMEGNSFTPCPKCDTHERASHGAVVQKVSLPK